MKNRVLVILAISIISSCRSPIQQVSDNILDSFKKINTSIQKSNVDLLRNRVAQDTHAEQRPYASYYHSIQQRVAKDPRSAQEADTLYMSVERTLDMIESISTTLAEKDPTGMNRKLATHLLVGTALGDSLQKALIHLSDCITATHISPEKRKEMESDMSGFHALRPKFENFKTWLSNKPTIMAMLQLADCKVKCLDAVYVTMKDIDDHMK